MSGLKKIQKDKDVTKQTKRRWGECSGISIYNVWMRVMDREKEIKEEDGQFGNVVFKTTVKNSMDCKNKRIGQFLYVYFLDQC